MRATTHLLLCCALLAGPVHAQKGTASLGASLLLTSTIGPEPDPSIPGYLRPNFHGSLEWPVLGLAINGGVLVTGRWELRGELALRRAASAQISEDEQSGHTEYRILSSRYENSERLLSVLVGRRIRATENVELSPVGGLTVSFATQRLTDRHGTYSYVRTFPVDAPDISVQTTSYGLGGGTDIVLGRSSSVAFIGGARLLWFHRKKTQSYYDRSVPPMGRYVLHLAAGVTWQPRR